MSGPIYKYCLQGSSNEYGRTTAVPAGKILFVAEQDGLLHVWIEVNKDTDHVQNLTVFATGEVVNNEEHVGSAKVGQFVWHVYKR
ncbi:MAG: hypothetical protein EOO38_02340 [Cytophagaceae bacterium]|nr:MAG: hypothetical protein EOO38_02340 [Cytophagaceae bacterium]